MAEDLVALLRLEASIEGDFAKNRKLLQAAAEIERLQDRLEMRHAWKDGKRVAVEPGTIPDGITCRDETIRLLDENIAKLRAEVERLRTVLAPYACPGRGICPAPWRNGKCLVDPCGNAAEALECGQ